MIFRALEVYKNAKILFANKPPNFAILLLSINDENLKNQYVERVRAHNHNTTNNVFPDSGFDLLVPEDAVFTNTVETKFIDHKVKSEMLYCDVEKDDLRTCAFTIHPRSSISKTPLMLANHTGIIDAGYRGNLIGAFRWLPSESNTLYVVDRGTRLLQACHPTLCPVYVAIVDESELSTTERGSGGFGSTM